MFAFTSAPQQDVLTTTPLSMLAQVSTAGDVELEVDYGAQVQCLAWSPSSAQLAAGSREALRVTESARAQSYYSSKQMQKTC